MKKGVIQFILLSFFLLSKFGQLELHANNLNEKPEGYSEISETTFFEEITVEQLFFIKANIDWLKESSYEYVELSEGEEEETLSLKKQTDSVRYFLATFCKKSPNVFFQKSKSWLSFYNQFLALSPTRLYLLFEVFRI